MVELPHVDDLLDAMAEQLRQRLGARQITQPAMVGIRTGGVWIAEQLHRRLGLAEPLGVLDIGFYRDDFTRIGLQPKVAPSQLPFTVDGRHLLLIDDVIMSGRTIRAALNELFDYGRPASVMLVALIDLPQRELPIQPDICGQRLELAVGERIKLAGPDPLSLRIERAALIHGR